MNTPITNENTALCIWSEAKILHHRLCNRNFACESCPLDAALRNNDVVDTGSDDLSFSTLNVPGPDESEAFPRSLIAPFLHLDICDECRYTRTHSWLRKDSTGVVWSGLDSFAAALLPHEGHIVTAAKNTHIHAGEAYAWIYGQSTVFELHAPLSGILMTRNDKLDQGVAHIRNAPYREGSIAAFLPDAGEYRVRTTHSAFQHAAVMRRDCSKLFNTLRRAIGSASTIAGACLNDGGEPIEDFEMLYGSRTYNTLIRNFLSPER